MSKSREQLIKYLSEIDITDKVVLDAGCGPKDKWARNFTKGEPKKYVTLDISETFRPDILADLNKYGGAAMITSEEGMESYDNSENYDIVFCIETLEHLWNPFDALRNLYAEVKDKGKLYLSTPFINPYHDEVDYARYTSEWYQKVLTEVGFKDIKIKTRRATNGLHHLIEFYKAEGLRMSKTRIKKGQGLKMAEIGYFVIASK